MTNSKLYSDKDGNLLKAGDIMKFEKLADTLEILAKQGADAFYTGQIAEDFIRDVQNEGIVDSVSNLCRPQRQYNYVRICKRLKTHLFRVHPRLCIAETSA